MTINLLIPASAACSPLFPYTTLFRSPILEILRAPAVVDHHLLRARRSGGQQAGDRKRGGGQQGPARLFERLRHRDRKSTRLNSSHLVNSYAVLCLKKKRRKIVDSTTH